MTKESEMRDWRRERRTRYTELRGGGGGGGGGEQWGYGEVRHSMAQYAKSQSNNQNVKYVIHDILES